MGNRRLKMDTSKTITFPIVDRVKFLLFCKMLARKHQLELTVDYWENEVIFTGANVDHIGSDLKKAITVYVGE